METCPETLSADAMAAVNAVEGLVLSAESKARLAYLASTSLTVSEKRAHVLAAYRKRAA